QVQAVRRAAPEEEEGARRGHLLDLQPHDLLPAPELCVGQAARALVLLQRRLDQDHVELALDGAEVERLQVALEVHGRRRRLPDQLVLEPDELLELGVLLEAVGQAHVADEVLRPLPGVHEVLAVVVVRVGALCALQEGARVPVCVHLFAALGTVRRAQRRPRRVGLQPRQLALRRRVVAALVGVWAHLGSFVLRTRRSLISQDLTQVAGGSGAELLGEQRPPLLRALLERLPNGELTAVHAGAAGAEAMR
ncbi:unnamed protein product, partial [Ixodes pacificus]